MRYSKNMQAGAFKRIGMNLLIIIGIYLFISLAACLVMFISNNPTGNIFTFSLISFLISGIISGFIIGKLNGEGKLLCIISALLFSILLLVIGIISSGKLTSILMNILCYMLVFTLFLFLSGIRRQRRIRRR